jgi:hypothetical protein
MWQEDGEECIMRSFINIIRVIKSRRLRWEGHVTRMEEIRNAYNTSV